MWYNLCAHLITIVMSYFWSYFSHLVNVDVNGIAVFTPCVGLYRKETACLSLTSCVRCKVTRWAPPCSVPVTLPATHSFHEMTTNKRQNKTLYAVPIYIYTYMIYIYTYMIYTYTYMIYTYIYMMYSGWPITCFSLYTCVDQKRQLGVVQRPWSSDGTDRWSEKGKWDLQRIRNSLLHALAGTLHVHTVNGTQIAGTSISRRVFNLHLYLEWNNNLTLVVYTCCWPVTARWLLGVVLSEKAFLHSGYPAVCLQLYKSKHPFWTRECYIHPRGKCQQLCSQNASQSKPYIEMGVHLG